MKKKLYKVMDLLEFEKENDVEVTVIERDRRMEAYTGNRYYATIENAEIGGDGILRSVHGNSNSVSGALKAYAREISRTTLVVDAYKETRRTINVPILTYEAHADDEERE